MRRGERRAAAYFAARRVELGASARRNANLRTVLAAWSNSTDDAQEWDQQARDLNALADRCGVFPQSNGAGPDD